MGRYKKHLIKILVCFCLVYTPFFANASANVGGWSMGNPVAQGASAVYTGTKNVIINGADYIKKGTAKITSPASGVAKVLARGVAGYALSVAVEQLIGSVDWVLDPANNRIVYYEPTIGAGPYTINIDGDKTFNTPQEACNAFGKRWQINNLKAVYLSGSNWGCNIGTANYATVVGAPPSTEEKSIPLSAVASQVISNAEAGDKNAQVATMAAAADIVEEASKDETKARPIAQQLESTAKTTPADQAAADSAGTGTGTQTKDPANPDVTNLTLEFPIFCNWAPSVCEAAQTVISFPQTLTDWWNTATTSIAEAWTSAKEWATSKTETTDTELDIPDEEEQGTDTNISFDNSCPAPISVPVSWNGNTIHFDFSFDMFCQSFGTYVKPIIIALGAFHAVLIVSGVRINE